MASSLSNLLNNLAKRINKIKCKYGHGDTKCEVCRIKCKGCKSFLEYKSVIDHLIEYKYLCCNKNYPKTIDENLKN